MTTETYYSIIRGKEETQVKKVLSEREIIRDPNLRYFFRLSKCSAKKQLGLKDNTVLTESKQISIFYFPGDGGNIDVEKGSSDAHKIIEALGGNYDRRENGRENRFVRSSYMDARFRQGIYAPWLGRNENHVRGRSDLLRDVEKVNENVDRWLNGERPKSRVEEENRPREEDRRVTNASKVFTGEKDKEIESLADNLKEFEDKDSFNEFKIAENEKRKRAFE